jgi:hypothetical protein
MKRYNDQQLDEKIDAFLSRKFEKYPELAKTRQEAPVLSKPSFASRLMHSLTSNASLSSAK